MPAAATFALRDDGKYLLPTCSTNPYKCHGILSGFLYQWASDNGFQRWAKMLAELSSKTFFSLLTSRSIFKDNAVIVGDFHGAWSHVLQWYFIIEHHKHLAFLRHSPIEIYQKLGDHAFLVAGAPVPPPWDIIHDAYNKNNFTSPEFMTHYFLEQSANTQWPLLSESIRRMQAKMFHKYGNEDGYAFHLRIKHAISDGAAFVVKQLP